MVLLYIITQQLRKHCISCLHRSFPWYHTNHWRKTVSVVRFLFEIHSISIKPKTMENRKPLCNCFRGIFLRPSSHGCVFIEYAIRYPVHRIQNDSFTSTRSFSTETEQFIRVHTNTINRLNTPYKNCAATCLALSFLWMVVMALIQASQISFESEVCGVRWRHYYNKICGPIHTHMKSFCIQIFPLWRAFSSHCVFSEYDTIVSIVFVWTGDENEKLLLHTRWIRIRVDGALNITTRIVFSILNRAFRK